MIGEFDAFWFIGLVGFAILCASLYIRHRSIWLIVGVHMAATVVDSSLSGAWRMGGLAELKLSAPSPLGFLASLVAVYSVVTWLVWRSAQRRAVL